MIHVSSYIKKNNKFQELSSPYLNCKIHTNDESFNSNFKKFVALLAKEDASFNDKSLIVIYKKLDIIIKSIKDKDIFIEFKNTMKKISATGELGKVIYDNYKIEKMAISEQNEIFIVNNDKFHDLENRIYYSINKCNNILSIDSFDDYDYMLNDLYSLKNELSKYNSSDNVDCFLVNKLNDSIDSSIKKLKDKNFERENEIKYNNILFNILEEV